MLRILAALFAVLSIAGAQTGRPELDLRVEVDRDGLYEISWRAVADYLPASGIRAERLILRRGSVEVPILFTGIDAGRFGRNSTIVFYGERNASPHTHVGVYRLRIGNGTARVREVDGPATAALNEVRVTGRYQEDLEFDPWETARSKILDIPENERTRWFWKRVPPPRESAASADNVATIALKMSPRPRPVEDAPSRLKIHLRSHLAKQGKQSMRVELGGRVVGDFEWSESGMHVLEVDVPTRVLKPLTLVTLRNTSTESTWREPANQVRQEYWNDILIDRIELSYPTLLTGPTSGSPHLVFDVEASDEARAVHFQSFRSGRFQVYDVARAVVYRNGRADIPAAVSRRFVVCDLDAYLAPRSISPWSKRNLLDERRGGDWVVVALSRLAEAVTPLASLRSSQGLTPYVVTDREVYDAFAGGEFTPHAIRHFLRWACDAWEIKPRYLLLVGDADRSVDWRSTKPTLPTIEVDTYYNGATASDAALVEGCSSPIAVGRLPMRNPTDVLVFANKVRQYELEPPQGDWRKRLNFIASEGRFGPAVDGMIESYAVRMLTDAIPAGYDVTMTYASAGSRYLYPPTRFNDQAIDRFNEGSLFYTYIGHGYEKGFDALRLADRRYPILSLNHLERIDAAGKNPVVTIIACSTAHFDDPDVDCIAEEMLDLPGGPIAIIGATRISHPLPNMFLGEHLMREFFGGQARLGDVFAAAGEKMVKMWNSPMAQMAAMMMKGVDRRRLMREHLDLYVLLGDPATSIPRPSGNVRIEAPAMATLGGSLAVTGTIDGMVEGKAVITVEARRDRIVHPTKALDPAAATEEEILANYRAANDKVISRVTVDVKDGAFAADLPLPEGFAAGAYVVKAFATAETGPAVGSRVIELERRVAESTPAPVGDDG